MVGRWMRGARVGWREEKTTDNLKIIKSAYRKEGRTVGEKNRDTQVCARRIFMKEQQRKCNMLVDIHSSFSIWFQFISRRSL